MCEPCPFPCLTPARVTHKAQDRRWESRSSTAGKEKEEEEEEEGRTKHLGLSQSLVCSTAKLCSKLVHDV